MSVTIGFVPLALVYGISAGISGLAVICNTQSIPKDLLKENARCSDELHQLLYPNLNAARRLTETEQAMPQNLPCFVRKTFVQDVDFAKKTMESLGGREEAIAEGKAFIMNDHAVLMLKNETDQAYELWMVGNLTEETATTLATQIEDEYKRLVQDHVHRALLERSSEYGLQLESEEVQSDQSVVLTFTV